MHRVRTFELLIREPLERSLDYGPHDEPEVFAAKYSGKKALQIIFGGVEGGKPIMIVSTLRVAEDGGLILDKAKVLGPGQVMCSGKAPQSPNIRPETRIGLRLSRMQSSASS
jgi:hypothetical protein